MFFRDSLRRLAERNGVCGWARNTADGTVEAVFEGPDGAVEDMVEWCRRGPELARVDEVEVADEEPVGEAGFRVTG